ncbi:uncharacterized protein LOC106143449 [Amyelois transitella]|uniref:uncharacterized protein LOC106143449 n=1 Tax=Amyelois transitella TaxID=680683 RepID=UPI00298F7726|nr:uncharacterized protein LOC106143449 [Amyelois transitella]
MARSAVTLLGFAVLLAVVKLGSSTMCYQCNSQSQAECGDPFKKDKIKLVDCSRDTEVLNFNNQYLRPLVSGFPVNILGAARYCHKIVTNTNTVIRVCMDDNPFALNTTCQMIAKSEAVKHCSVCDKDNCNGAASISASLPLALVALFASYFYLKQ